MVDTKPILRTGLVAQAGALALKNARLLKKKKLKSKDLVKSGTSSITNISLLRAQASLVESM